MQDPKAIPWGAQDRYQAHYIVRRQIESDYDVIAKTVLDTQGWFGAKRIKRVSWNGGKLADALNADSKLCADMAKLPIKEASILVEPAGDKIRIYGKWYNHIEFGVSKELFDIYDRIAGHAKSL